MCVVVTASTRALNYEAFRGKGGHCDCKLQNYSRSNKGSVVFIEAKKYTTLNFNIRPLQCDGGYK